VQWAWNYFTRGRGARLITGESTKMKDEKIMVTEERNFAAK
jgi:hypothetical protein